MSAAISISGLVKTFGRTRALDGLDLSVETGEVHGFLGPNGAGKTTTLRVLLGLLRPDSGTVRLLDGDPWRDVPALHRRLAYVPGDVSLWPNLTGGEVIDLLGRLRGGLDPRRRDDLLERFDLDPRKKGRAYSKGNRQKVALVAALASDVELLLLDEPTSGLDPLMEETFRTVIREERERGERTVLLSSHILAEAEALCDRVSIIRKGRTVESGTLAELRHLTRTSISADLAEVPQGLAELDGVHDLEVEGTRVRCEVETARLDAVLRRLADAGVRGLVSQPPTLEELFLRHYSDDLARANGGDAARAEGVPGRTSRAGQEAQS
jgi:ABC-2 type transport system ATP-binding protein